MLNTLLLEQRIFADDDLVEVGCFQGRCSIVLGYHLMHDEFLRVVNLFGNTPQSLDNQHGVNTNPYDGLSEESFQKDYARFHECPSVTFIGESEDFLRGLVLGTVRLVHVDGSHAYRQVSIDLELARTSLVCNGVLTVDDYRSMHIPGVAAAIWPMISNASYSAMAANRPMGRSAP